MTVTIENEFLLISVASAGAELSSLYSKKHKTDYLWNGNAEWWPRRAPVLFPIVGKLNQNNYRVSGKAYTLPQHGFARDSEFELLKQDETSVSFILKSSTATLEKYPFAFEFIVFYTLKGNSLAVGYEVKNPASTPLYFSVGAHPGFAFTKGETLSDYYIEFEQKETLSRYLIEEGVFTGGTESVMTDSSRLDLNDELMTKDAIVFKGMKSTKLILKSKKSDYRIEFDSPGFPYFGIWSKPGAPFVCLEPWCGMADNKGFTGEFKDKEGVESVAAGGIFQRAFVVTI